ncbi:modular serine protease-like isoform X2 [Galleria mellonella]|uniref:Modular serine protease-like isoform X2 n=1 Tax=Galleria mellonella TaxID=7137 RepID=A0ABM3MSZ9_GALME|nr:modular serine protease-like isoform X2 [Galleria mellonella]
MSICSTRNTAVMQSVICGDACERYKRATCRKDQWQCRDGTCIGFDGKCDGVVDCPDGSDETHPLCRSSRCQSNWFRCTYGACVDGTAPCNGVQDCADNSDELHPLCRNESRPINFVVCTNGVNIPAEYQCDGIWHCPDGSDEMVRSCAAQTCPPYLFQCAYGACVDQGADCNGIQECADDSDESDELCRRISVTSDLSNRNYDKVTPQAGACVLPPYPENGRYTVTNAPNQSPGQSSDLYLLNVTCEKGYRVFGESNVYCFQGFWSVDNLPSCVRYCRLPPEQSVEYWCAVADGVVEGRRACAEHEPHGTVVRTQCKPGYYGRPPTMTCVDGAWDFHARCSQECGHVTPDGEELIIGGRRAERGELPWHCGIYRKTTTPYMQICGSSLVRPNVVISAAHCFWSEDVGLLPARDFSVAAGKLYRPWHDPMDTDVQKSDVSSIHKPSRFTGSLSNFQEDIAIVKLTTSFTYKPHIAPVCLDFDEGFDKYQLDGKRLGKVAGWGLTSINGEASPKLKVVELPSVDYNKCYQQVPYNFRAYLTSDKICAGYKDNGTAVCKGDSGGGLAFPEFERTTVRFYLRGVVSTAPNDENLCNGNTITALTHVLKHASFIRKYL